VNLEKLGTFLHSRRREAGIPLAKAAQRAGIGRSTLWIIESGNNPKTGKPSRPSKEILERLAEVLHLSQDELEEVLSLADYTVTKQLRNVSAGSDQIKRAMKTGIAPPPPSSLTPLITEINGKVYLVNNEYLQAFDAETGKRLWSSSTAESPFKPIQMEREERMGLIFVLSGIAGRENDSVLLEIAKNDIFVAPTVTTRPHYQGERQGKPRIFLSEKDFIEYKDKGIFLTYMFHEWKQAWYGHERAPIVQSFRMGQDVIMDAGPEEALMLRKIRSDAVLIHLEPPADVRTEEEHKQWEKRLQQVKYQYTIKYELHQLQKAVADLSDIIAHERQKARQVQQGNVEVSLTLEHSPEIKLQEHEE
jgi:guanylate kinase/transcriptional regulator with XRE-family HTH domain